MFPQSSYNTPHGYQFGRAEAEFQEEPGINPNLWDEALSERTFEETHEDEDRRAALEQAQAIAISSRVEAQEMAVPAERQDSREFDVAYARTIADVGRHNRYSNRDRINAGEPTQEETARAFGFNVFKSKEQKHDAKVSRMSERQLVQAESEIGKTIFGPVPTGGRREFFNLDEDTWIWHEEWIGTDKQKNFRTTRYEVRGDEVIKSQDGEKRAYVTGSELQNLATATRYYYDRVTRAIYHRDPATGRKLVDIL